METRGSCPIHRSLHPPAPHTPPPPYSEPAPVAVFSEALVVDMGPCASGAPPVLVPPPLPPLQLHRRSNTSQRSRGWSMGGTARGCMIWCWSCAQGRTGRGAGRVDWCAPRFVHHQYSTVQYSTVQYSTVQYSTVQHSTVQYSTAQDQKRGAERVDGCALRFVHHQCSTVQYSTVQFSTVQYSTVQYSTAQYSTAQDQKRGAERVDGCALRFVHHQYRTVQYSTVQHRTKSGAGRRTCGIGCPVPPKACASLMQRASH